MVLKKIITVPDEILRKISEPIEKVGMNEKSLIKNLFYTMYNANGIGLAAIQVGIPKRIVVMDVSKDKNSPICMINPIIKKFSKETSTYEEGCLSIPDTFIEIQRPKLVNIDYIDENGKKKQVICDNLLSTCAQHEIQHCDGKLIIDYLSKLKKDFIIKKISKIKKEPNRIVV